VSIVSEAPPTRGQGVYRGLEGADVGDFGGLFGLGAAHQLAGGAYLARIILVRKVFTPTSDSEPSCFLCS